MVQAQTYDLIVLSPHLDDAALSCGGQIYAASLRGERVLIVTVTAGDPAASVSDYAAGLHNRWELVADATEARRQEDLAACAILGAEALHWTVPDCIYRTDAQGAPFYLSDADIFGNVAAAEMVLVEQLAAQMRALPPANIVLAPLAVGHHVDHQLTRLAAEEAFGDALEYYEDYPYAQLPGKLAQVVEQPGVEWCAEVIPLDEQALRAKYDAVSAFRSQLSTFFRDRSDLEAQIGGYATATGGERRWRSVAKIVE